MQKFNYHTHTYRCGHADENMMDEEYVKEFIKKGFKKIAFTDHAPQKNKIDKRSNMRMDYNQKEEYLHSIKTLKEKYSNEIQIETGFEVEYLPGQEFNLIELKNEVDKIVLGQHFIYADDNKNLKIFRNNKFSENDLIKYANYIESAMEKGIPDIVVHPDLYMLSSETFGEIESRVAHLICKASEKYNIPLEINLEDIAFYLLGYIRKVRYPSKEFWTIASQYNIRVLYGIDAHFKEQIRTFDECVNLATDIIGKEIIDKLNFIDNM